MLKRVFIAVFLCFKLFLLTQNCHAESLCLNIKAENSSLDEYHIWKESEGEARGVIILVHGLNVSLQAMQGLADEFKNYHVLMVAVSRKGPAENWIESIRRAHCEAQAKYPDLPLYALGHSAGGATLIVFFQKYAEHNIQSAALLAPAISITRTSYLVRPLTFLRYIGVALPCLTSKKHRRNFFTPLGAYQALFQLSNFIQDLKPSEQSSGLTKVRCEIFIDPDDSLVRYQGVKNWLKNQQLNWEVSDTIPQKTRQLAAHHLIFDKDIMGESAWNKMINEIKVLFKEK